MKKNPLLKPGAKASVRKYGDSTYQNVAEVIGSESCRCLHCKNVYHPSEITDWSGPLSEEDPLGMLSAICPYCGFVTVVPSSKGLELEGEAFEEASKFYFPSEKCPEVKEMMSEFLTQYDDGNLSETQRNESLFLQYVTEYANEGNNFALVRLGLYYEFGSYLIKPDMKVAFSFYANDALKADGFSYARLGQCIEKGANGAPDYDAAFDCYAHSAALGNDYGRLYLADCFHEGRHVPADREKAWAIYMSLYHAVYNTFTASRGENPHILPELAMRIADHVLEDPNAGDDQYYMALHYYLIGRCALSYKKKNPLFVHFGLDEMEDEFNRKIQDLALILDLGESEPCFDADCLYDSMDIYGNACYLEQGGGHVVFEDVPGEHPSINATIHMAQGHMFVVDTMSLYAGFEDTPITFILEDVEGVYPRKRKNFTFVDISCLMRIGYCFESGQGDDKDLIIELKSVVEDVPPSDDRKGQA